MIKQIMDEITSLKAKFNKSETETPDVNLELAEVTFSDGRIARYEGEELKVDIELSMVTPEGEVLATEGAYEVAESGTILSVDADGKIISITEVPQEEKEVEMSKEDIIKVISEQVAEDIKHFEESIKEEYKVKFENQAKEIKELKASFVKQLDLFEKFAKVPMAAPSNTPETSIKKPNYLDRFRKPTINN